MLLLLFFLASLAWFLYRFITADGDLTLLRKGAPRRSAVENKVVWITGASQGIGEVLAQQFAKLGAKLILSARRVHELERVKASLSGSNVTNGVAILPFDITAGIEEIKDAVTKANAFFDGAGIDYMVLNAAYIRPKFAALDASEEFTKDTFAVNFFGTINLAQLIVPSMIKRGGGTLVVVSSAAGKIPSPAQTIYASSKHAVNGYFHSLRAELADKNIKVTVACPGPIDTTPSDGNSNLRRNKLQLSEQRLSVSRCAELIITAATHGLKDCTASHFASDVCCPISSVNWIYNY